MLSIVSSEKREGANVPLVLFANAIQIPMQKYPQNNCTYNLKNDEKEIPQRKIFNKW